MLTIFAIPRSFDNHAGIIQRNAILSWLKLKPECEIILFGDEKGVREIAKEFNIIHVPEIKKNKFGTPLIDDVFEKAQSLARHDFLCYVNTDIILMPDFLKAFKKNTEKKFLIVGRRTDLNIKNLINFKEIDWSEKLFTEIKEKGLLHGPSGIDYFIFPRGLWEKIPPFALGRATWDNWLLYKAWLSGAKLIDATRIVAIIHQNHSFCHRRTGVWNGPEVEMNIKLAGGLSHALTIRDVDFILTEEGLKKPKITFYRIISFPFRYFGKVSLPFKILLFPGWLLIIWWKKIKYYLSNF